MLPFVLSAVEGQANQHLNKPRRQIQELLWRIIAFGSIVWEVTISMFGRGLSRRRKRHCLYRMARAAVILCLAQAKRGAMLFRVGTGECMIILVMLVIVAGLAYRGGYFRGRRRD